MIDYDDELERAQARLERGAELMDAAVVIGDVGDAYLLDWYRDLTPEDKALLDDRVAEIRAALDQLAEGAAQTAEILATALQGAFQVMAEAARRFIDEWPMVFGGAVLPQANGSLSQYDPYNARSMWKWDPATARPGKRPLREVRFNQVSARQWRNGRRGR
ncbi:MAG: hypothetical protein R3D55_11980 [Chloroflexota bacterium]